MEVILIQISSLGLILWVGRYSLLGTCCRIFKLNLPSVNKVVDPTFRFMTVDWDVRSVWTLLLLCYAGFNLN